VGSGMCALRWSGRSRAALTDVTEIASARDEQEVSRWTGRGLRRESAVFAQLGVP
jgi:hypothetical protein